MATRSIVQGFGGFSRRVLFRIETIFGSCSRVASSVEKIYVIREINLPSGHLQPRAKKGNFAARTEAVFRFSVNSMTGRQDTLTSRFNTVLYTGRGGKARLHFRSLAQDIFQTHVPTVLHAAVGIDCIAPCQRAPKPQLGDSVQKS